MLRRQVFWLILLLVLMPAGVMAQGAPEQIDEALNQLSAVVNQNLTLNDLENWRWAQDLYPDLSLGCPQPDTAYAQIGTQGFRFLLTYESVVYDIRVSADREIAFICSRTGDGEQAGATSTPVDDDAIDTSVACPDPEPGVIYLPQRLTSEIQARVVDGPPLIQRSEPSDNGAVTGEVPAQAIVNIVTGPVCADGQIWWQVDYDGRAGWTVEGRDGNYWLDTVPALALPANLAAFTVENAGRVAELSRVEANIVPALAASPAGDRVAVLGGPGTSGVWLYDLAALDAMPRLLRGTVLLTDVAFGPQGQSLLLGDATGGIRVWSTAQDTTLLERWFDQGHEMVTTAVAFGPDARTVASAGDVAVTGVEIDTNNAILLWDVEDVAQKFALGGHTATVNAMTFSPDGSLLVSASDDQTVRLWNPVEGSSVAVLEGHEAPVLAVAFSPDGTQLASASSDGAILLWDVDTQAVAATVQASGPAVAALAFSPDGTLLASAGGDDAMADYTVSLWDVAAGEVIAVLDGHTDNVGSLAFNADGSVLVSAGADKAVRFWGAAS